MEELGSCFIMFAYHGPKDESDPEAVMLRVDINLQVTRSRSSEDQVKINSGIIKGVSFKDVHCDRMERLRE